VAEPHFDNTQRVPQCTTEEVASCPFAQRLHFLPHQALLPTYLLVESLCKRFMLFTSCSKLSATLDWPRGYSTSSTFPSSFLQLSRNRAWKTHVLPWCFQTLQVQMLSEAWQAPSAPFSQVTILEYFRRLGYVLPSSVPKFSAIYKRHQSSSTASASFSSFSCFLEIKARQIHVLPPVCFQNYLPHIHDTQATGTALKVLQKKPK
jgi:hypothetical protein